MVNDKASVLSKCLVAKALRGRTETNKPKLTNSFVVNTFKRNVKETGSFP